MKHKLFWLGLLLAAVVSAGDITPGRTWVTGEQVTAAKMNDFLNSASINSTFYTSRTTSTAPGGAEVIIFYDSSAQAFRKITLDGLLQRTNLITDLTPATSLATNDVFMVVSGGELTSVTFSNVAISVTPYVSVTASNFALSNLSAQAVFNPTLTNSTVYFLTWTNDWTGTNWGPFRRLSAPDLLTSYVPNLGTNAMLPYTWAQVFKPETLYRTNNYTNAWGYTNVVAITNLTHPGTNTATLVAADTIPIGSTQQGTNTTVTLGALSQYITNGMGQFVTAEYDIASGRTATNHNLGTTPTWVRWVLVCKTNDVGYSAGEEVAVTSFWDATGFSTPPFSVGASSTNIFAVFISSGAGNLETVNGTNGTASTGITKVRWRLKGYARP